MSTLGNVLVTGGAGYIGSHTCKALKLAGYLPVSYDNLSTGNADAVKFGPLITADLKDRHALKSAMEQYKIVAILHFAASAYVGESVREPLRYYDNNVGGMVALLDVALDAGISSIVFSSSCATYGIPSTIPITEDTPQAPINPYGRTKLIGEQMLADFSAAYGLRHVALRYFNVAGADPTGELGERHDPETHLIPLALLAAAGKRPALSIFGTDYATPDGTCIRDYIHVTDLARAHVLALDHLMRGGPSLQMNLGSGKGHSVREIVSGVEAITGRALPVVLEARRPGDPPLLTSNPSLAAKLLGFKAELSDLDTILRHAAPWFGVSDHVSV